LTETAAWSPGHPVADLAAAGEALLAAAPSAAAAVECATADLASRASGESLATQLGSQAPLEQVRVHALVTATAPADVAAGAREAIRAGFAGCKLKVGVGSVADDVERIMRLRQAAGEQCLLRLDANGAWSVEDALRVLEATASLGIDYVEDPVADWEAMAALKERIDVRLAADQMLRRMDDVSIAADVASVAVIKPSAVGGPWHALAMAGAAVDAGLAVVFGSLLESAV
jgi:L-alanine-DL-glutamate epimerase-like enolase superfamily enzyme